MNKDTLITWLSAALFLLSYLVVSQHRADLKRRKQMDHLTDIITNLTRRLR